MRRSPHRRAPHRRSRCRLARSSAASGPIPTTSIRMAPARDEPRSRRGTRRAGGRQVRHRLTIGPGTPDHADEPASHRPSAVGSPHRVTGAPSRTGGRRRAVGATTAARAAHRSSAAGSQASDSPLKQNVPSTSTMTWSGVVRRRDHDHPVRRLGGVRPRDDRRGEGGSLPITLVNPHRCVERGVVAVGVGDVVRVGDHDDGDPTECRQTTGEPGRSTGARRRGRFPRGHCTRKGFAPTELRALSPHRHAPVAGRIGWCDRPPLPRLRADGPGRAHLGRDLGESRSSSLPTGRRPNTNLPSEAGRRVREPPTATPRSRCTAGRRTSHPRRPPDDVPRAERGTRLFHCWRAVLCNIGFVRCRHDRGRGRDGPHGTDPPSDFRGGGRRAEPQSGGSTR